MSNTPHSEEADALAARCAQALYDRDPASKLLGMYIERADAAGCEVRMTVRDDMLNGHGTCHGGFIYSLADSAFAFACNARNITNVALDCTIDYLAPARAGDMLMAYARTIHRTRKTSLVEVVVNKPDGTDIARFRGRSYQLSTKVLEDTP